MRIATWSSSEGGCCAVRPAELIASLGRRSRLHYSGSWWVRQLSGERRGGGRAVASRELADCSGAQLRSRRLSAGSASSADSRKLRGIAAVSRPGRLRRLVFASELVTDDGTAPRRLLPSGGTAELRRASRGGAARCCSISLRYDSIRTRRRRPMAMLSSLPS